MKDKKEEEKNRQKERQKDSRKEGRWEERKEGSNKGKKGRKKRGMNKLINKQRKDLTNLNKGNHSSSSIVSRTHDTHVNTLTTATIILIFSIIN